jgi:hypothetical protein
MWMSDCPGSAVSIGGAPLAARVSRVAAGPLRIPTNSATISLHFASRYLDIQPFFSMLLYNVNRYTSIDSIAWQRARYLVSAALLQKMVIALNTAPSLVTRKNSPR